MDALTTYQQVNDFTTETFIRQHAPMVKRMAYHMLGRLPQTVLLDDLIQAGMMGLLDAVKNYDITKGASFETYASIRIRGHMLDEVRRNDWVPRSVYKNSRMISEAIKKIENETGVSAKDVDVAKSLNLSLEEYNAMLQDSAGSQLYGFDDVGITDDLMSGDSDANCFEPQKDVMHNDLMHFIANIIESLPQKEKIVLSLYYEQELNLKEIGEVLEVSESRVSQILTQATARIKARLPER